MSQLLPVSTCWSTKHPISTLNYSLVFFVPVWFLILFNTPIAAATFAKSVLNSIWLQANFALLRNVTLNSSNQNPHSTFWTDWDSSIWNAARPTASRFTSTIYFFTRNFVLIYNLILIWVNELIKHRKVCEQPSIPCLHNCGNGKLYKSLQDLIDHLEQDCPEASVICETCAFKLKRKEHDDTHWCTAELIRKVNSSDNSTIKAVL